MPAPRKPFESYKWRWASFQPSEGLTEPPVFLGVLRALSTTEGEAPSSDAVFEALRAVENQIQGRVEFSGRLAREAPRDLLRNSGQYWKALGVLADTAGGIRLTAFGRDVAVGQITRTEFAAATIATLSLPNRRIESNVEVAKWEAAGLEIHPLRIVLDTLKRLMDGDRSGASAFLTTQELIRIVIPLAGVQATIEAHVDAIQRHRVGDLDISDWPDCAPAANDRRMAREFLLFLAYYGFVRKLGDHHFIADQSTVGEATAIQEIAAVSNEPSEAARQARESATLLFVERNRVLSEVLARPQQTLFRKRVLEGYGWRCLLTGETTKAVLEAGHIIPVKNRGSDELSNGICLRADIHMLFDSGHIRISPDGSIELSEMLDESVSYSSLPGNVGIPKFVSEEAIRWRYQLE
jgi:hypothetical protein